MKKGKPMGLPFFIFCRDGGIRTHDLLHPMQARYQAALHPECLQLVILQISFYSSAFD
jgi:hypothetical protein